MTGQKVRTWPRVIYCVTRYRLVSIPPCNAGLGHDWSRCFFLFNFKFVPTWQQYYLISKDDTDDANVLIWKKNKFYLGPNQTQIWPYFNDHKCKVYFAEISVRAGHSFKTVFTASLLLLLGIFCTLLSRVLLLASSSTAASLRSDLERADLQNLFHSCSRDINHIRMLLLTVSCGSKANKVQACGVPLKNLVASFD